MYVCCKQEKQKCNQPPYTTWYLEYTENPEERNIEIHIIYLLI